MNPTLRYELVQMDEHDQEYPLEDSSKVDEWRAALGLPSMAELKTTAPQPRPCDSAAAQTAEEAELAWRRAVGWLR